MANKKFNREEALELKRKGWTYKNIAQHLGCSEAWCAKALAGAEKGTEMVDKVVVDGSKQAAIKILEEALEKVRAL